MPPSADRIPQAVLPPALSEPRIVLAIDYGTTFTGLAWIQMRGDRAPQFEDLNLFVDWPERNEAKVPSEVSYSLTRGVDDERQYRQWGYSIDGQSKVLRWTKLELVNNRSPLQNLGMLQELMNGLAEINRLHDHGLETSDMPRHLTKTTGDVIEFYLGHVAREWHSKISGQARYALENVPVDIVVTHPAMWPDDARNTLVRAICGAFNTAMLPTRRNIHIMSEPDACALYVIQGVIRKGNKPLQAGDCFTLCDAGGGTVDLVTYYLDSIVPLKMIKVGNVSGSPIGATTVDRAFLAWLDTKLGNLDIRPAEYGKGGHYILMPKGNLLLSRFEPFKRSFTGSESYELRVPRDVVIRSLEDEEARQLHISADDMKDMFGQSINGIKRLINEQVISAEERVQHGRKCRVSNIFLAGGFAESEYLYQEVKKTAARFGYITVHRADDCWSSVVKGAALGGMAVGAKLPPMITTCPRSYGISTQSGYDGGIWTRDAIDRSASSPNRVIWLINKGDIIFPSSQIQKAVKLCYNTTDIKLTTAITVLANDSDSVPTELENLSTQDRTVSETLVIRTASLKPSAFTKHRSTGLRLTGRTYYEIWVTVELTVKNTLVVEVKHGSQVIAYTTFGL